MIPIFESPITRRNYGRGHGYRDARGHKVPGVTTICKQYAKPALMGYSARKAAEVVLNEWDALGDMQPSDRYEYVRKAANRHTSERAARGTELHKWGTLVLDGKEVEVPEEQHALVDSYVRFLDDYAVNPLHVEFGVCSYQYGYGGTGDLIAEIAHPDWMGESESALIDVKTSGGIYEDMTLQIAAYRYAAELFIPKGERIPMPKVDAAYILHIRQDDYDLVPVDANETAFEYFVHLRHLHEFSEGVGREFIGEALPHPVTSPEGQ